MSLSYLFHVLKNYDSCKSENNEAHNITQLEYYMKRVKWISFAYNRQTKLWNKINWKHILSLPKWGFTLTNTLIRVMIIFKNKCISCVAHKIMFIFLQKNKND